MAVCTGTTKAGKPCGMRPAAGQSLCVNHGGAKSEKKTERPERKEGTGKGPGASQESSAAGVGGIVAGVAVGGLLAAGLVYAALRVGSGPEAAAPGNVQPLRRPA